MPEQSGAMQPDAEAVVDTLRRRFRERYGEGGAVHIVRAPGRVNLIGEHTDYNDGFVLPMTIDRAVYVALRCRPDRSVRFYAINVEEEIAAELDALPVPPPGHWSSYVLGVVHELRGRELLDAGVEGVIFGDVPPGTGLSSSAALEVAVAYGLQVACGFDLAPEAMALLCQHVEHRYADVQCGIMDQFASRLGRQGEALFIDCRTLGVRHVPMPLEEARVVLVDSGVRRALASSAYNERRRACEEAVAYFRRFDASVRALRDVTPALLAAHAAGLPEGVRRRAQHVVEENGRAEAAVGCLERGDLAGLGRLMNQSHDSLRDLYEVSCPELDHLVEAARRVRGVYGARLTGAGFGGCTVNLVARDAVAQLVAQVRASYAAAFRREATVYVLERNVETGPLLAGAP